MCPMEIAGNRNKCKVIYSMQNYILFFSRLTTFEFEFEPFISSNVQLVFPIINNNKQIKVNFRLLLLK